MRREYIQLQKCINVFQGVYEAYQSCFKSLCCLFRLLRLGVQLLKWAPVRTTYRISCIRCTARQKQSNPSQVVCKSFQVCSKSLCHLVWLFCLGGQLMEHDPARTMYTSACRASKTAKMHIIMSRKHSNIVSKFLCRLVWLFCHSVQLLEYVPVKTTCRTSSIGCTTEQKPIPSCLQNYSICF